MISGAPSFCYKSEYNKAMKLSVIIPAYNEENRIAKTLKAVDGYLKKQPYDYEILVVSDGSKDNTVQVARETGVMGLRVIDNKENRGKGYAVRKGMMEAKGDFRLFMDADNATSVDHVEKMWSEVERGFDVVMCSRDIAGSVLAVPQSWFRRRLGDIFNLIVQIFSGLWGMWDTQCGFKGFTKKATEDIFPKATIDRWAFDVELLVLAKKRGYKIKEIPVTWVNDPESKVKLSGMIKMLFEVLQIRLNMWKGIYG